MPEISIFQIILNFVNISNEFIGLIIYIILVKIIMVIKMKNKTWILAIILLIVLFGVGVYFYMKTTQNNNQQNYEAQRTSTTNNNQNNINNNNTEEKNNSTENETSEEEKQEENKSQEQQKANEQKKQEYKEEQLATFSTKIYSKDSARQNNINITCNTLNNTTVKNGDTFSFCNTVGKATSAKGYQEADVYDHNGNKTKGLGGGNCQVSSTLYNAVLAVSSLKVTERHEHSNDVPYVKDGKDAAVAYGSYDFKFINNTGNSIKIKASTDGKSVTISINSIKPI